MAKKKQVKKATRKAIRTTEPDRPALSRKLTIAQFRKRFGETAQNRSRAGKTEDPITLVLDGGSTVTKGRDHVLVVEDARRVGKFRIELRSE